MNRFRNIFKAFFLLAGVILLFRVIHTCERFEPERELYFYTDTIIAQAARGTYLFSGAVVHTGKDEITEHGFCWSHSGGPTLEEDTAAGLGPLSEPDSFAVTVTGLDAGTTYFVRCFVTTGEGTVYSEDKSFTTPGADLPEVTTSAVTQIGQDSAQSGGTITDDGGDSITARGVCWDTNASPTIAANHTTDGTGSGTFTSAITGLSPATLYHVRAYATNARGTAYGNDVTFTTLTGPGSTVADYDGNVYPTVQIGEQVWMAENLKTTHYADGSAIPLVEGNTDWDNLTPSDKAYCWYDNSTTSGETYGGLYTWAAAMGGTAGSDANPSGIQGVCPDGWHMPSDAEWKQLEMFLGMSQAEADSSGWRGTDAGGKLKEAGEAHWNSPNTGATNESGFTALPGGGRLDDGTFYDAGSFAGFWTASESSASDAWCRGLVNNYAGVGRVDRIKEYGYSVRCVQGEGSSVTIPTVTTAAIGSITTTSAEGGGEVTGDGGAAVTARGVCWSTSVYPTTADDHTTDGTGTGSFTSQITGLTPQTTYYARAYATNGAGTGYGPEFTFKTWKGTVTDIDGNTYWTVGIGSQTWMGENLAVTHFADGTPIPHVEGETEWEALFTVDKAYCRYDNSGPWGTIYGALYTWPAAMNSAGSSSANPSGVQGVCPDGWHLPSDAEWKELEICLGMSQADADSENVRGTDEGGKLKETGTAHWNNPNTGATNSSGFTALPGGVRFSSGVFGGLGEYASFWSSTENQSWDAWRRFLNYSDQRVIRNYYSMDYGFSVRCVQGEGSSVTIPTVTTAAIGSITTNSAEGGGEVTGDGGAAVTARGVCWSTSVNPTTADNHTTDGTGTGSFTSQITGLTPQTTYYARAYATNSKGTDYGPEFTFKTWKGSVSDIDGNTYWTVGIGSQTWMAENLKVTNYANGTPIPLVENNSVWHAMTEADKAYCWSDNSTTNRDTYGGLYTWAAAMNGAASSDANPSGVQGVCPDDWHLPSDAEWKQLEMYLGMSSGEADQNGWRGTDEGGKLKEAGTAHWYSPNTGATNESGFTALPGGYRGYDGSFSGVGYNGRWWSSSEYVPLYAGGRSLSYDYANVYRTSYGEHLGFSIRCVQD